jgi:DNA repair protein RecN (Recombination protein N)
MISYALSELRRISEMDSFATPIYEQLAATEDLLSDCIRSLTDYEERLDFSPEDLERTSQRLDVINNLKMKYGQSIEKINERLAEESEKVAKLSDYETYLSDLQKRKEDAHKEVLDICSRVSAIRKKEAVVLQKEIEAALDGLNFPDAKFEIVITSDEDQVTQNGYDDVEFMISTNPGEELKPLTNVASGGELSRIMLALKSVLAKRDSIGTLIFDEIDSGISGKTAQLVADRMADIATDHQVIAITHLPQIASHAKAHYLIEKMTQAGHTSTNVRELSYDDSVEELARMLAGSEITDAVMQNASELKRSYGRAEQGKN